MKKLKLIAQQMVNAGKGILAADESTPTCTKRFESLKIESTELIRNKYRSALFTTENLENYISGVILFQETFNQNIIINNNVSKKSVPEYLKEKGILTGIKVDTGAKTLAKHFPEKITEGLDGLRERLQVYKEKGADFAKWRGVITIGESIPSEACMQSNAHALARYASLCQENELVPIVEPEVLMDGNHEIGECYETTCKILNMVFEELKLLKVDLEGIVLKPNMVLPSKNAKILATDKLIAKMTFDALKKHVPKEVPGIAFLSGGQSSDLAAKRLNKLNAVYMKDKPWRLTFSYGRALQEDALLNFSHGSLKKTQEALIYRAKMNHLASMGKMN